jgi:dipeptidyl aminopeptidase/acylaminoacyl peptidase
MGHGYGGYAALMLAQQDEVRLACAISASAPTELELYVRSLTSFGGGAGYAYAARIGDPVAGRSKLVHASPLAHADEMNLPLLLFHGRQDACVPVSHLTAFADALRQADKPHEVIIYEDEGHVYSRPQNVADFRLRTLEFLHTKLMARAESAG